jgi:DNA ligase-1
VAFAEGAAGLNAIRLQVLRPVLPMLAATAVDVGEAVAACGLSSVEWKLDGARVQIHRRGPDVRIFTRNLNDITDRLVGVATIVRSMPATSLILDAEVIGVRLDERPDVFQSTMSRFSRQVGVEQPAVESAPGAELHAWFFDCLHLDGHDLIDEPLVDRLAALERVAGEWRIPATVTDDPVVGATVLEEALAAGHEGVMVKAIGSRYEAGRRGRSWRKVKPVRTFDLVVLAAEWGHGRRRGWLSNLHLGARDPGSDGFVMVGKTFKGLTDALLTWQTEQLRQLAVEERGITVFVRPELVVEIALDGVQVSPRYAGGVALRFARVKRYRPDKSPSEADTIDAVRALLPASGQVIL